jgi:Putative DNA-binding domain
VYAAHAVVGPRPPFWDENRWRYEVCTFLAVRTTSHRLADALDTGELVVGSVRGIFALSPGDQYQWRRDPSFARFERLGIPWPTVLYELSLSGLQNTRLPEPLIGQGSTTPSFRLAGAAYGAFFFNEFQATPTTHPALGRVELRIIDTRARFRRVRSRPGALDVFLDGDAVKGATLELNGPTYRRRSRLSGTGPVWWPLPPGAMDDAWIWLKRGSDWLDYRAPISWGGPRGPDDEQILDSSDDPVAEVTALASQGEGQHLEYKETLPAPGGGTTRAEQNARRTAFKDIVAFANGGGGRVLFGVTDQGEIVGLDGPASKLRDRLSELVRSRVFPSPPHQIYSRTVDEKLVLVLEVDPNERILYSLLIDASKPEYYIRREGTTYPARADEIAAIFTLPGRMQA